MSELMREIEMKRVGNKEKEEEGGGRARKPKV